MVEMGQCGVRTPATGRQGAAGPPGMLLGFSCHDAWNLLEASCGTSCSVSGRKYPGAAGFPPGAASEPVASARSLSGRASHRFPGPAAPEPVHPLTRWYHVPSSSATCAHPCCPGVYTPWGPSRSPPAFLLPSLHPSAAPGRSAARLALTTRWPALLTAQPPSHPQPLQAPPLPARDTRSVRPTPRAPQAKPPFAKVQPTLSFLRPQLRGAPHLPTRSPTSPPGHPPPHNTPHPTPSLLAYQPSHQPMTVRGARGWADTVAAGRGKGDLRGPPTPRQGTEGKPFLYAQQF